MPKSGSTKEIEFFAIRVCVVERNGEAEFGH